MKLTKEEYEAHPCVGKSISVSYGSHGKDEDDEAEDSLEPCLLGNMKRSSYYSVCSRECDGHIPKCHYAIRPRCVSDNVGPTCYEIVEEFLATKPSGYKTFTNILHLYIDTYLGYEWICSDCQYWERRDGKNAFSSTHGVKNLLSRIYSFLTYFLIRKCMSSDKERQAAAKGMKMLVLFCIEKQYCSASEGNNVIDEFWKSCSNFKGETIVAELNRLKREGYWKILAQEDDEIHSKKRPFKEAGLEDDNDEYNDEYEETINSEFPMTVSKITKEGWIFSDSSGYFNDFDDFDDAVKKEKEILLRLPQVVGKLGKEGMSISCMSLGRTRSIWSPFNPYDEDSACANVYPS